MTEVIIIDDDFLVVNSLKTIVEAAGIKVLAIGLNGEEALELYINHKPNLVLMDIRMDVLDGIQATEKILYHDPKANILLITTFQDEDYIQKALSLGAKGYILKENISGIIPAIKAVLAGNMVFDSKVISKIALRPRPDKQGLLSNRELDILLLVAEGLSNKEIASRLYLSEGTIRNYISNMLDKLDLRDRTQLAIYYYKYKE